MNHPAHEEWVPYLYGEAEPKARRQLKNHLQTCPQCRSQLQQWQQNLRRLDAWRLPAAPAAASQSFIPVLRWALAAVLLLAAGIGVGHSMGSNASVDRVRARLAPELRQQLRQEFALMLRQEMDKTATATLRAARDEARNLITDSASNLETRRLEENQAIYSALDRLFLSLKKDVDTVAVNTDVSLRRLALSASGEQGLEPSQP